MTCPTFHPRRKSSVVSRTSSPEPSPSGEEDFQPPRAIAPHPDRKDRMIPRCHSTTAGRPPIRWCRSHLVPRFRMDGTLPPTESGREHPELRQHSPARRHAGKLRTLAALPPSRRASDTPVPETCPRHSGAEHLRAELHHRASARADFSAEQNEPRCSQNPAKVSECKLLKLEATPRTSSAVSLTQTERQIVHFRRQCPGSRFPTPLIQSCYKIQMLELLCVEVACGLTARC